MSYPSLCGFVSNGEYFGHLQELFEFLKRIRICVTPENLKKNELVKRKVLVQVFEFSFSSSLFSFVFENHDAMREFCQVVSFRSKVNFMQGQI